MATLFNVQTRQPEEVPDGSVDQALATGSHTLPANTTVPLKFDDGTYGSVPAENIQVALSKGGTSVVTPTSAAIDQTVQDNSGWGGTAKVFAGALGDNMLLGVPGAIYKNTADPLSVAKWEAVKKSHELADDLGTVAGIGASFIPGTPAAALFGIAGKAGGIAEKAIMGTAAATAAEGGVEIGARTVGNTARKIAATLAGGATEGAVITAPVALTEEALGDPDLAAESLLSGLGVGALVGVGGMGAKALLGLSKAALEKAAGAIGEVPSSAQKIAQGIAETSTGVKGADIENYLQNSQRMNASPLKPVIKDMMDADVDQFATHIDNATSAATQSNDDMNTAYKLRLQDLRSAQAPENLRNELMNDYVASKAKIGDISQQINQTLGDAQGTFNVEGLKQKVADAADSLLVGKTETTAGAVLGPESQAAYNSLKGLETSLSNLPKEVSAQETRQIVQQLGENANYGLPPGTFNSASDKAFKNLRTYVRDELQNISPEAGSLMSQIHEISNRRQDLEKYFGKMDNPQILDGKLNALVTKNNQPAIDALDRFGAVFQKHYPEQLGTLAQSKNLLKEASINPIPEKIVPDHFMRNEQAQKNLADMKDKYGDIVKRLDRMKTENIINKLGYNRANIEDRRLMDKMSELTGKNYSQMIEDRNIVDSFDKKSTNGSRKVMAGYAAGSAVGGPVGGAIGAGAAYVSDVYSGKILKAFLDRRPDVSGLLFVEQRMKDAANKLDRIPDVLDKMSSKIPGTLRGRIMDVAAQAVENKKKKHENIDELKNRVSELQGNPNAFITHVSNYSSPISTLGAPNVGAAFSAKMSNAYSFLNQNMPKAAAPVSAYAPQVTHKPSNYDISQFNQKLQIIQDPYTIIDELHHGTLTPTHVQTMQQVYPALYKAMQQKVQMHTMKEPKPMSYQGRVKLSMFMGQPTDATMTPGSVAMFQHMFEIPDETVDTRGKPSVNLSQQSMTEAQKLENS